MGDGSYGLVICVFCSLVASLQRLLVLLRFGFGRVDGGTLQTFFGGGASPPRDSIQMLADLQHRIITLYHVDPNARAPILEPDFYIYIYIAIGLPRVGMKCCFQVTR